MGMSTRCLVGKLRFWGLPVLSCFFALLLQSTTGRELKSVIAVFRSGDRSPLSTFPTNPVKEDVWPQGYGQLSQEGMKQQFALGQFIRKRYKHFLNIRYLRKELYARSTDYDRNIMGALTSLAGLYPPSGNQVWRNNLLWQPVPVHTVPAEHEKLLVSPTRPCKRFDMLQKETFQHNKNQIFLDTDKAFLTKLADKMGYDAKTILDFTNQKLWNVYDALVVQKLHKKVVPAWATPNTIIRLKMILSQAVNAMFGVHKQKEKARLQGGILVKEILKKFTTDTESNNHPKLILYSAHDLTLVALQSALNVYNQQLPPYAACQFFELYKENNGEYTIEMHYRLNNAGEAFRLIMPGCAAACPLERFKEMVGPVISDDVEKECDDVQ